MTTKQDPDKITISTIGTDGTQKPAVFRSQVESSPKLYFIGGVLGIALVVFAVGSWVGNFQPGAYRALAATQTREFFLDRREATKDARGLVAASPVLPATPTPTIVVSDVITDIPLRVALMDTPTPLPTVAPDVVYIEVPVTVVSEVRIEVQPTPTAVLSPGTIRLCVFGEGLTGIYLDGVGMVGNTCEQFTLSSPSNVYQIVVTK